MTGMTPEEADNRSHARARRNTRRMQILAVFVLLTLFSLAWLLQREEAELADAVYNTCTQRAANATRTVEFYSRMIELERTRVRDTPDTATRIIDAYQAAMPTIPACVR